MSQRWIVDRVLQIAFMSYLNGKLDKCTLSLIENKLESQQWEHNTLIKVLKEKPFSSKNICTSITERAIEF